LVFVVALLSTATAHAADFYLLSVYDGTASIVRPEEITDIGGGHKVAVLNNVNALSNSIDASKLELDCATPQWKPISEFFYDIDGTAEPLDKTHLSKPEWRSIPAGSLAMVFHTFVCRWPTPSETAEKLEDVDIRSLARRIAPNLYDTIEE
jgi:hypothetical protein